MMWRVVYILIMLCMVEVMAQLINRPPQFLPGGDKAKFSLPEDTHVGAPVYRLLGSDPEGTHVHYSISGEYFNVDRTSGIVKLIKQLDRETLEVIISITDESVGGAEPNTVSLRREIPILDINDNPPEFINRPYIFAVTENTKVGSILYSNITVIDKDVGVNSELKFKCFKFAVFNIDSEKMFLLYISSAKTKL